MEVVWSSARHITYHTWYHELAKELAGVEAKDQEIAEMCVKVAAFYKAIEDATPPRVLTDPAY